MEISIRKATLADIGTLRQFEQGLIAAERAFSPLLKPDPVAYYNLEAMLTDPQVVFVVAVLANALIACGFARIEKTKPYNRPEQQAYLGMMYVEPQHRGKGVNGLIVAALKEMVEQRGVTELCLEVFSENEPAIKAYQKAGFRAHIVQMRLN